MGAPKLPDDYEPPWLPSLLTHLAENPNLREWCEKPGNPSHVTVYNHAQRNKSIAYRLARARSYSAKTHGEEEIRRRSIGPVDDDGNYDPSQDSAVRVARDRLAIDKLQWLMGVWDPETYATDHRQTQGSINITISTGVPERIEARKRLRVDADASEPVEPQEDTTEAEG